MKRPAYIARLLYIQHILLTKYHSLSQFEARRIKYNSKRDINDVIIISCFLAMQYWLKLSVLVG